jgi:hypothetical protein
MSPCRGVMLPKVELIRVQPLITEEVIAVTGAVGDRYPGLVVLAAVWGRALGSKS